jgi:hypothetical protein
VATTLSVTRHVGRARPLGRYRDLMRWRDGWWFVRREVHHEGRGGVLKPLRSALCVAQASAGVGGSDGRAPARAEAGRPPADDGAMYLRSVAPVARTSSQNLVTENLTHLGPQFLDYPPTGR